MSAPQWIRVLPLGKVDLRDGREGFEVTIKDLEAIITKFETEGVDLVVDYEHQTLTGKKAPAAGWVTDLEVREDGLWAKINWTDTARRHIEAGEYRYYSPVVRLNKDWRPVALLHIGLVNDPAISNLKPLLAAKYGNGGEDYEVIIMGVNDEAREAQKKREAKWGISPKDGGHLTKPSEWADVPDDQFADPVNYRYPMPNADQVRAAWAYWNKPKNQEQYSNAERAVIEKRIMARAEEVGVSIRKEAKMKAEIANLLQLEAEAPAEEVLAVLKAKLAVADALGEIALAAGLESGATPSQIKGAVLALKQGQEHLANLQREVAELKTRIARGEAEAAVATALQARKITPAQRDWALKYAASDPEGFQAFVAQAPEVIPGGGRLTQPTEKSTLGLDQEEMAVCKQMGLSPKQFLAAKQALAAAD